MLSRVRSQTRMVWSRDTVATDRPLPDMTRTSTLPRCPRREASSPPVATSQTWTRSWTAVTSSRPSGVNTAGAVMGPSALPSVRTTSPVAVSIRQIVQSERMMASSRLSGENARLRSTMNCLPLIVGGSRLPLATSQKCTTPAP